jgi:hypothetical protein
MKKNKVYKKKIISELEQKELFQTKNLLMNGKNIPLKNSFFQPLLLKMKIILIKSKKINPKIKIFYKVL